MSAYRDALSITSQESGQRLELAETMLVEAQGVVLLDNFLALRPSGDHILCEVIANGAHDQIGYQAAVAEAKSLLAASSIFNVVSGMLMVWLAVEDYGSGTIEMWRAS